MFVLTLLAGCAAVRLAYNSAPQFSWWWVDGYFDFDSEHAPRVKQAIDQWFGWHRQSQLQGYAAWLASVERRVADPITPAQMCGLYEQARQMLQPAMDRALEATADVAHGIGAAQIAHLEQRYAKINAELRRDFLQPDAEERRQAALKRTVERAERIYGSLEDAQRRVVEAAQAQSPFDAQFWLAERERRQRELLQALRRWQAERPERAQLLDIMRQLAERAELGTSAEYRAYQQRLSDHNCRVAAELHNSATPTQRQAVRKRFLGWVDDLRALSGERQK